MLRVKGALETRGHTPIALIFDGVLFLENQPLSDDSLQDLCDEVGVTVCAKELTGAPPRGDGQSLWERLRARGSSSGPMPIAYDAIPDHACLVSACSMLPANKEITVDMPPGPYAYREAQELLGVRFDPAGNEALASGGTFVLSVWTYLPALVESRPCCRSGRTSQPFWKAVRRSNCLRRKFRGYLAHATLGRVGSSFFRGNRRTARLLPGTGWGRGGL